VPFELTTKNNINHTTYRMKKQFEKCLASINESSYDKDIK